MFNATTPPGSSNPSNTKTASLHDSARGSPEVNGFNELVHSINDILGPCNGIDSAGVDVEELKSLMAGYKSTESEWTQFAFADYSRGYTRNLVDNCNGKSNLLILVWSPKRASPIHDHANAHCVMKILSGTLTETIYGWPCEHVDNPADCAKFTPFDSASNVQPSGTGHTCSVKPEDLEPAALQVRRSTAYARDQVTYMSDSLGLHRIQNCGDEVAVSLHLYTPPNAAKHGCHIFDESTGKKSHVQQCHFYSEFGKMV